MLKRLVLVPVLASLVLLSCSKNDSIVDSRPVIDTTAVRLLSLSAYLVDTDTIDVVPGQVKSPTDPVQIPLGVTVHTTADIPQERMRCRISFEADDQEIVVTTLPRIAAQQYGAVVPVQITRGDVGDYRVEVYDPEGSSPVNTARTKFTVVFGNRAPILSDLVAPDTAVRPSTLKLTIRVTDPSGPQDIKSVFFNSYRPNGSPASTGVQLFDDGLSLHGDAVAGDGIYSLIIDLPTTAVAGDWRFEFRAIDYSNLTSNVIVHFITVL